MKLWEKDKKSLEKVLKFTIGNDPSFDKLLAPYDIIASMAHAVMLGETGIITKEESRALVAALASYYPETCKESFQLNPGDEDIHSHLENYLISNLGETGKKIHTARSRNDQVLVALQLLIKEELRLIIHELISLFEVIIQQAEKYEKVLIPGYTHTQVAMPSSLGIWLGAYAESLVSDLMITHGIVKVVDQNSLGSAAGFGSSFPIDRELTSNLIGFDNLLVSSVSAQLSRGKLEAQVAFSLGTISTTLSRLAADMILYMGQDFNFLSFPDELTTGSSIMPHKKNPDVLELVRAHCNTVIQMPATLINMSSNLISGYHRDFQLTKEILFPGFDKVRNCIEMTKLMLANMHVRERILDDEKYKYIFSVDAVNKKVMEGKAFRDAYMEVAKDIETGEYISHVASQYSHIGSIGNPGFDRIKTKMAGIQKMISITPIEEIFKKLSKL